MIQALLNVLPALLCPLGMVVMLWMMRRHPTDGDTAEPWTGVVPAQRGGIRAVAGSLWHGLRCCVNWKVGLSLVLVGVGIWLVAPGRVAAAVPLLLVLLCPLSMLLMLGGGRHGREHAPMAPPTTALPMPERVQDSQS